MNKGAFYFYFRRGVTIVASAVAALVISPLVSYQFEQDARKSQFYIQTLDGLTSDTKELLGDLTVLYEPSVSDEKREALYLEVRRKITKLQWRSFEFALIYEQEIKGKVTAYQNALSALESEVRDKDWEASEFPRKEIENFGKESANLVQFLAEKADVDDRSFIVRFYEYTLG